MWHYFALLCCAWLSLCSAMSSYATVLIDENFQHAALGTELSYFCDTSNQLTLEEVKEKIFTPVAKPEVSFGYNKPSCWFKFEAENQHAFPVQLVLSNNYNTFDRIDIFFRLGDSIQQKSIGDTVDYSSRELQVRTLATPIDLPARSEVQFYIKAQTTGNFYLPLEISTYNYFLTAGKKYENILGIGYGIVVSLFFYHLFLLFLTKEKVQFFYILYVGCTLLFFASQQGSLFQFWPKSPQWNHLSFYSFCLLALSSGLFFSRLFLNTKNNIILHKWMKNFAISLAFLSIFHIFLPTPLISIACSIFGLLLIIALFIIAFRRYIEGFAEATLFLIAWGFLLIVVAAMIIMMNLGMGNINIAMLLAQLAFAAQQVLLSIGLAQRINSLKREKEQTEKEIAIAQAENKAKTDFLARMSHEIRTPMNAVLGVTQLLENTSLTDVQQHYINLLKNSGKLLISIINDILDYAKINSGNLSLENAVFDLPKLLVSTQQIMISNLKNKQIELIFDIDNQLPQWVEADPTRLQQILFNLLSNALKFTQKGSVRLEVRQLFQMNKDTSQLQITITDTGIGLSSEQLKNLFSAFHQADASITRKYGGTGLGLAISKQLIDLMRGSIKVHSQVNKGTTFIILLHVKIAHEVANTTNPILPALGWGDFSKLRVLLVEDNSINQLIISSLLNQLKIEPHLANNGEEAIDFIQQHHNQLDVVLMDCEMPILDGLEATRKIRDWEKNHQQAPIPIIALTAHALPEYKERCLAVGMTDYLSKPLLLEQLMNKLLNIQKNNS